MISPTKSQAQVQPHGSHNALTALLLALMVLQGFACKGSSSKELVAVEVHTVTYVPEEEAIAVILVEKQGRRFVPIMVDRSQGLAIYLGQSEQTPTRPMTHDLMANFIKALGGEVDRIVISDLRGGVYYSRIEVHRNNQQVAVDARPSDAIALSQRVHAPIFVAERLLQQEEKGALEFLPESSLVIREWGVTLQVLRGNLARFFAVKEGVLVADVTPGGPAARGDVQPGDILTAIEKRPVTTVQSARDLFRRLADKQAIEIRLLRESRPLVLRLQR